MDFFIINDAIIQKICILGEDVEPCFEGASVTAPDVSTNFTLDDNFKHTLYSMMQDLKNALNGGEQQMDNLENTTVVEETEVKPATEFKQIEETVETTPEVTEDIEDTSAPIDYVKKEEDEEETKSEDNETSETDSEEEDEDEDAKKKYTALEQELNTLKESYSALQIQYKELLNFKKEVDNQKKDELIAEFYMLSDEDKKDVISNKEKYTLEEIKAKLSVVCFDKKINFTMASEKEKPSENNEDIVTYDLNVNDKSLPEWVKAVKEQERLS